ncbi:hypothetical protein CTRI78_v000681 [Colletotrichum trifolii]|uniref:Uncharacterized protein n=1 Tax=Colletotrichum trifolii TaxID=5466 RepID=A0A4R8RRH4_COLTR|nr:hypothetical protein CTRI78_v000681 [Colletotrichum trifolii]
MKFFQGLIASSMVAGAMAGCQSAPEVCESDVGPISRGLTVGWVCDLAADTPCAATTCEDTGERQRSDGPGLQTMKCCKPCSNCKATSKPDC